MQLVEEGQIPEKKSEVDSLSPSNIDTAMATHGGSSTHLSVSSFNTSRLSIEKSDDEHSLSSTGTADSKNSRRKPVRKAPPPPGENARSPGGGSKLPTPTRPSHPPPMVPGSAKSESTPDPKSNRNNNAAVSGGLNVSNISGNSDTIDGKYDPLKKPLVPKRYIKPKLHKVSKRRINLQGAHNANRGAKSPPPPRPEYPKNLPKTPLNRSASSSYNSTENSKLDASVNSVSNASQSRIDSDISGVENLDSFNSSKSDDRNKELASKSSEKSSPSGGKGVSKIPMFTKQTSVSGDRKIKSASGEDELDGQMDIALSGDGRTDNVLQGEQSHSTPKVKDVPKFNVETTLSTNSNLENDIGESDKIEPMDQSESSLQEVSKLQDSSVSEVDSSLKERKSLSKIPQSPKQSRLPRLGKDDDKSKIPRVGRSVSPKAKPPLAKPPPVAPKPVRPSHIQKPKIHSGFVESDSYVSTDVDNESGLEESKELSSLMQDDGVVITDGLDSSNNNSNLVSDPGVQKTETVSKPQSSIPVSRSPQKSQSRSSRIPKGPGNSPKKETLQNSSPKKSEIPKYTSQTSTTSQDSSVFSDDGASGFKPKRPDKPPQIPIGTSPRSQSRKTSASPSRIPKGTSGPGTGVRTPSPSKLPTAKSGQGRGSVGKSSSGIPVRPGKPPTTPPAKIRRTSSQQDDSVVRYSPCTEDFYISILHITSSIQHKKFIQSNPILSYPTKIFNIILVETNVQCSPVIVLYIALVIYATKGEFTLIDCFPFL